MFGGRQGRNDREIGTETYCPRNSEMKVAARVSATLRKVTLCVVILASRIDVQIRRRGRPHVKVAELKGKILGRSPAFRWLA